MTTIEKPSRIRSPSYPCIDLETAILRAKQLYEFARRSPVMIPVILPKWGYNSQSANGMKVVAALKNYGLVEDSGKKDSRKIQLTELAFRIIHDHNESLQKQSDIKTAALSPAMYQYCWDHWGKDLPHDEVIKSHLIIEKKFNSDAVSGFLSDYKKTIEFAKLSDSDKLSETDSDTLEAQHIDSINKDENKSRVSPKKVTLPSKEAGMRQDIFTLDEGQVVLQWPEKLSQESFDDFEMWLQLIIRKTKRSLVTKSDSDSDPNNVDDLAR